MNKHIEEPIIMNSYYESREYKRQKSLNSIDHDIVSKRIKTLLSSPNFYLTPDFLREIHSYLFKGIYPNPGQYRDYDITRKEFILNLDSVAYAHYTDIASYLEYDFKQEKKYPNQPKRIKTIPEHIALFNSDIWGTHPFNDGNTRTIEVFIVKYLNYLGLNISNALFINNALYFRNSLVRSNYSNPSLDIEPDYSYLIKFYENLILRSNHELKSRDLIVRKLYRTK